MPPRRTIARLVFAAGFTAVMAFLALRSSPYLQYIPWMPRRLGVWADHHGVLRNTVGFFVFAFAIYLLVGRRPWQVAVLCIFATAIEVAQIWIPGRTFDWRDIVASIIGVLLAWPVAWLLARGLRRTS
jgi:glycopeptide antibiotics resistance protein